MRCDLRRVKHLQRTKLAESVRVYVAPNLRVCFTPRYRTTWPIYVLFLVFKSTLNTFITATCAWTSQFLLYRFCICLSLLSLSPIELLDVMPLHQPIHTNFTSTASKSCTPTSTASRSKKIVSFSIGLILIFTYQVYLHRNTPRQFKPLSSHTN